MEFRDAVKYLRSELGLTQVELATGLNVNAITIGRWENGRSMPTRSLLAVLIEYARSKGASQHCLEELNQAIVCTAKYKLEKSCEGLYTVEHASLRQLIDDASFPIYVCDLETDELLYLNRKAAAMIGGVSEVLGRKCYDCLMHLDAPCSFCHKLELSSDCFQEFEAVRGFDGKTFRVQGKLIQWNGHRAQVRYVLQQSNAPQLELMVDDDRPTAPLARALSKNASQSLPMIIESINGGVSVVVLGADGTARLSYASAMYYELFGYTKEQFVSELNDPHDLLYPEDAQYAGFMIEQVKETHRPAAFKYRVVRRDGSIITLCCSASVTFSESIGAYILISVLTDISSSESSEQQAIALGERLNAIVNNVDSAITAVKLSKDGCVEYLIVNDRYYGLLGFTKEQYRKEVSSPFDLIYSEDSQTVRRAVTTLQELGKTISLQYRVVRRDGHILWINARISLMSLAGADQPVQLSVFTDVTRMVEAKKRLKEQHDQLDEILNTTPTGIAVVEVDPRDMQGTLHTTYYNDRFFRFSGYTREEYDALLRSNEMSFVFDEDIPLLLADTKTICEGEIGNARNSTIRCHTKDGGYRWMLLTGQLAKKQGNTCVVKISLVDVTAQKEAEDKQRISEEMLRIAAETDKRALVIFNVKTDTCRAESHGLYSAAYGELIHDVPAALYQRGLVCAESADECDRLFARIRAGQQHVTCSLLLKTGEDTYQWFECNTTTVFDAHGAPDHAVLVFHNITEQRVKEAVFKKWQQSIETRPKESYTLFRCNLSKDASLDEQEGELLKIEYAPEAQAFNARTKQYAEAYIYPDDRKAYEDLLDSNTLLSMYYRGERSAIMEYREISADGELFWRRVTIEMVEYLHSTDIQAFLMYEDIDDAKKAELEARELAAADPLTGVLNRAAFAEKVENLLGGEGSDQHALLMIDMDGFKQLNDTFGHAAGDQALQDITAVLRSFSRSGDLVGRLGGDEFVVWLRSVPYDAVIKKTAQQICEHIRKAFSQSVILSASIGIAVFPRDGHDFDELYRNADRALYKVKQSHKGTCAFYSVTDEEQTPEVTQALTTIRKAPQSTRGNKRRILIVDDNAISRALLKGIFKDEYHVEFARNGAEAMIRLRHFGASISVVLLDLFMPGMDGFTVLKKIQDNVELRTIPVIVVSGDEGRETLLKAVELGAADYITKPVDPELIKIRVKSAISKAENERLRAQNSYLQLQRDEELKFRTVLESTGTVVIEYDWRNHVFIYDGDISKYIAGTFDNRGLWQVFLSDMVADSADVKAMQDLLLSLAGKSAPRATLMVKLKTPSRQKHWFRMSIYKTEDEFGLAEKMILTYNDVHEEVLANDKLLYQATRDALTGLYNRAGFISEAARLIAAKEPGYYVIACIDIERFKVINDQYGTKKGDEVLRRFAQVLQTLHQGENSICCRFTSDKFAVLYPAQLLDSPELASIHYAIEHLDDSIPAIRFAAGRCLVDDKALDVSSICDRAAIAKGTIKGRYDIHIATYDESMRTAILRQQEIIGQMNHALEAGQFEVWFQPQFNHATGKLSGAEALVRWRHPKDGIISPSEFIPIFERNGFIYELDKYVWEQTARFLRRWLDAGLNPAPVSVNISRYDVFRGDLISTIEGLSKKYALPLSLLRLEVTETAFSESSEQIIRAVQALVDAGFTVEIDDFGSGYSSLNTLKDVPAQILKLDMRFLENDRNAQRGGSIIESVVRMAKWLGMSVIAEGVETIEQADYLKSIGCELVQGFLYARPMQAQEYEKLSEASATETKLSQLHSVETWNNNAFWNPKSMETLIFNSYVGGACIFEYAGEAAELLRYNAAYAKIFGRDSDFDYADAHRNILSVLDAPNAARLRSCIQEAITTKKEAVREIEIMNRANTALMFLRATMRQIAEAGERRLFYCVVTDITEQRMAEKKQLESARQLETVMNNVNGGVSALIINSDGTSHFVFNNARYYELYGYTKEQAAAERVDVMMRIVPEDFPGVMEKIAKLKVDKLPTTIDYRIKRRNGQLAYLRATCSLMHMDGYGDEVITSVLTDITQQREINDKFRAVVDNMNGGVSATYLRGETPEFVIVNDRYYEITGYTKAQFEAEVTNIFDLIVPSDRAQVEQQFKNASEHPGQQYTMEYRFTRRDGAVRHILCNTKVIHLFGVTEPVQLAVSTDITELREAQQKERNLSTQIKTIMSNIQGGITAAIFHDITHVDLLFANDGFYGFYGYTKAQWEREVPTPIDLIVPEDRERTMKIVERIMKTRKSETYEYRCRKRDGTIMWTQATNTVISLDGVADPVLLAVVTDVTEQRNIVAQLQYINDAAHNILMQTDTEQAITGTLKTLLQYHQADRGYVVELNHEKMLSYNTYEVCADGVSSEKEHLQALPFRPDDFWYDTLMREEYFYIGNAAALDDTKAQVRELLAAQGIQSILLAPLFMHGTLAGFAGLDNPRIHLKESERLLAMSDYLSIVLIRRDATRKRERDSRTIIELMNGTPGGFVRMKVLSNGAAIPVYVNEGFQKLTGMNQDKLMHTCGHDVIFAVHPDDYAQVTQYRQQLLSTGSIEGVRYRITNGRGGYTWISLSGRVVKDDLGDSYANIYFTNATAQLDEENR